MLRHYLQTECQNKCFNLILILNSLLFELLSQCLFYCFITACSWHSCNGKSNIFFIFFLEDRVSILTKLHRFSEEDDGEKELISVETRVLTLLQKNGERHSTYFHFCNHFYKFHSLSSPN